MNKTAGGSRAQNSQNPVRLSSEGQRTGWAAYESLWDQFHKENLLSVRQIPPNRRSVTGLVPSRKNGAMVPFESALERDFATTLEFDPAVAEYGAQPLALSYLGPDGRKRRGVPDFLVRYQPHLGARPLLVDVKYRREIFERWAELKPRLRAARQHAHAAGWDYRIKTEVEIRTPYLNNAKFLLPYQRCAPDPRHEVVLAEMLARMETATPTTLLRACAADEWVQAQLMPTLWNMVGRRSIGIDLEDALTMKSLLWHHRVGQ